MRAAVSVEAGRMVLAEKPVPKIGPRDALLRVTTTTICGLQPLVTYRFTLDEIEKAYELFASQRDGMVKVAIAL